VGKDIAMIERVPSFDFDSEYQRLRDEYKVDEFTRKACELVSRLEDEENRSQLPRA
jgi:hypothetical protein